MLHDIQTLLETLKWRYAHAAVEDALKRAQTNKPSYSAFCWTSCARNTRANAITPLPAV